MRHRIFATGLGARAAIGATKGGVVSWIRSRLTFANVAAGLALFVALGGGAYAATSDALVGSGGKIHGCVQKNGALSVAKVGKTCPKHTTSLVFDQTGPRGAAGSTGAQGAAGTAGTPGAAGAPGAPGAAGPGATSYFTTVAAGGTYDGVTLANGVLILGGCPATGAGNNVDLQLRAEPDTHGTGGFDLQASGTQASDGTLTALDDDNPGGTGPILTGTNSVDLDVIARSSQTSSDTFYMVDFHADYDSSTSSCNFWGVTTPASS